MDRKIVKISNLEEFTKLVQNVRVAACMFTEPQQTVDEESVIKRLNAINLEGNVQGIAQCSCCGVGPFETRAQQTAHYKHHWHTHNLKRKLFGKPPLTLGDFSNRQDDNSSVSDSDSESDDGGGKNPESDLFAVATRHCKAFFTNSAGKVFSIYRCVLHHRKENLSSDGHGLSWINACQELARPCNQKWATIMISGGRFAAAIFVGGDAALHKTFNSYVVRRGQGHMQTTRDNHGNAPKSGGASLRRYNQQQFALHIQEVLRGWKQELAECHLILYRAVGPINHSILFGVDSPLAKDDIRLRVLPFPTKRPTFKEVKRAFDVITTVEVYDTMEKFQKMLIATSSYQESQNERSRKEKKQIVNRAKSREPVVREIPPHAISSEDEAPSFIDSEKPEDWINVLKEQTKNGVITSSRADMINDSTVHPISTTASEADPEEITKVKHVSSKKSKKKLKNKEEGGKATKKILPPKVPSNIRKMWNVITAGDMMTLDSIVECWEGEVSLAAAINMADPNDGNTALHKAAIASNPEIVTKILNSGGDPCVRNNALQTPYVAASQPDTRIAFRLYQGQYPEQHNYAKAHIPGPMTPEQIQLEKDKKAQQKKAKRLKDKQKQVEKIKANHFLDMSDVEKTRTTENRCFLCGTRVPLQSFQYEEYKFCSIKCLQNHRNLRPLKMSA